MAVACITFKPVAIVGRSAGFRIQPDTLTPQQGHTA